MSMNERIYKIDQLLAGRRCVTISELLEKLEISKATLKRDLTLMRDRFNAPIVFDKELGGYRFEIRNTSQGVPYELPGLWFSAEEIHALLTMQHLLSSLDTGGLLGSHIQPLLSRLTALLGSANDPADEIQRRIKIRMVGVRHVHLDHFESIGFALLKRKRIRIDHHARSKDASTQREVSPQRMIYYQGNWYLDAWCHLRNDLRSFSVDAIHRVEILEKKSKDVPDKRLDEVLGAGYGIFAGKKVQWATLLFSPEAARWVSNEHWHQNQKGKFHEDGSYELKIPYSKDTELLMDILRYGARVKVLAPAALTNRVSKEIDAMKLAYL
ncbi:MAG: YafY family protein [Gallionellaceae bacterium]|nr:YafY family protein [Gallionellaceae bacterium]